MFAVIKTGGKQYRVQEGDVIKVEKLTGEKDSTVTFEDVLLLHDGENTKAAAADLENVKVTATIIDQAKDKKILVFKKRRRQGYSKKQGHRQQYSEIKINKIEA